MLTNESCLSAIKAWECQDSTAPFFDSPLVMHRAKGSVIWDVEGKPYVDLCAGFGALAFGHSGQPYREVLQESLAADQCPLIDHSMGDVYASSAKYDLFALLAEILPPHLQRYALALTGAQAVEIALKTAIYQQQEPHVLVFRGGYHGVDLGLLPLSQQSFFTAPFSGWQDRRFVHGAELNQNLDELEANFFRKFPLAAVLVEPIQGRAGVRPAELTWLKGLSTLAKRYGACFILDEVFTGFGRSGRMTFADEVPCDLVCFGKAMGGGMPVSLCAGTAAVFDRWSPSEGEARHTGTFFGHPLSLRVSHRTLRALQDPLLLDQVSVTGAQALSYLRENLLGHPTIKEIRGQGLMLAVEFVGSGLGLSMMHQLRAKGVIALVSGSNAQCLSITPALNIAWVEFFPALECLVSLVRQQSSNV